MSPCYCGIDSGSWNTKAVLIDDDAKVLSTAVVRSGADLPGAADEAFALALRRAGLERETVKATWSTGFGRRNVPFADDRRTELDCHARGVRHYVDGPVTIVDIGGQDAKVIRLDETGRRISHRMNRKCAAGTGSFLEEIALRLDVDITGLPALASGYAEELELGSFCTVFTGTELLAEIRRGRRPADLARAAYRSLARRVIEMEVLDGRIVATGGVVAFHPMIVEMLEALSSCAVEIPPHPQEMGAFGAAVAAMEAAGGRRPMRAPGVRKTS